MTADEHTTGRSPAGSSPRRAQRSEEGGAAAEIFKAGLSHQSRAERPSGRSARAGKEPDDPGIGIMLSQAQIEHVVGASMRSGPPSMAALLGGLNAGQAVSRVSLEER